MSYSQPPPQPPAGPGAQPMPPQGYNEATGNSGQGVMSAPGPPRGPPTGQSQAPLLAQEPPQGPPPGSQWGAPPPSGQGPPPQQHPPAQMPAQMQPQAQQGPPQGPPRGPPQVSQAPLTGPPMAVGGPPSAHQAKSRYPRPASATIPPPVPTGFAQPGGGAAPGPSGGMSPAVSQPYAAPPPMANGDAASGGPGFAAADPRARPRYPSQPNGGSTPGAGALPPGAGQAPASALDRPSLSTDPAAAFDLMGSRTVLPPSPVRAPIPELPESHRRRNVSPKVIRSSLNRVPIQQALLRKSKIPFAVTIYPFGPEELPCIESTVIRRCRTCRTYMNPFVTFLSHGRRWRCNMCFRVDNVPEDFDYDSIQRKHVERSERPELNYASVEYVAPSEYMVRPPQPCIYMFVIDVSQEAVANGMVELVCNAILANLKTMTGDARTKVGFVTFDHQLHFYNLATSQSQPRMLIVDDIEDAFIPLPQDLVVNLKESFDNVKLLLEGLPAMFKGTTSTSSCLAEALKAGRKLVQHLGARMTVFQTARPNVGEGKIERPQDAKLNGDDLAGLQPSNAFYKQFSVESSRCQIGIDLFSFGRGYVDLATLSQTVKFAAGMTYFYEAFSATNVEQRRKAEKEIGHYLTRSLGLEAVLRVRASSGLVMSTFHGHFFVRSADLLALPNVSPDNSYTLQVTYEHDLPENQQYAYFQVALLYTSSTGERRIRVHTLALPTATTLGEIFSSADAQAIASVLAKMAIDRALSSRLSDAREAMINLVADCLKAYRELMGGGADRGLISPNSLRLLPLYVLGLLKNAAFTVEPGVAIDSRANAMTMMKVLPLWELKEFMYPRLYALHNLPEDVGLKDEQNRLPMPVVLHASASVIERGGIYLLSNSQYMLLYVTRDTPAQMCSDLFACGYSELKCGPVDIPRGESTLSKKVRNIVRGLRSCHPRYLVLVLITEESKLRPIFMQHLVDDKMGSQPSYFELLQDIQKRAS